MVKQHKPVAALFGGSFDPPHIGHRRIVEAALKKLPIDAVIVEPTWKNPFKASFHAAPELRLSWVKRLFANNRRVVVDDYEVRRKESVPTFETLKHLQTSYDIRYLIVGADNLSSLTQWHRFDALNRELTWVVIPRRGYEADTAPLRNVVLLEVDIPVSSTYIRTTGDTSMVDTTIRHDVNETYNTNRKDHTDVT